MLSKTKSGSLIAALVAAASIAALTACASSGTTGAAGAGSVTSPVASSSAPATGPGAASSQGAPGGQTTSAPQPGQGAGGGQTAAGTPECKAADLRVSYTDNQQINNGALVGMSKTDKVVMFVNAGQATCVIQGYPGVAALSASGVQVRQAKRSGEAVHPVSLRPGAVASALISADTASCAAPVAVAGLLVTAPDQYSSTRLGAPGEMCLGSLTVHPVAAGSAAGLRL